MLFIITEERGVEGGRGKVGKREGKKVEREIEMHLTRNMQELHKKDFQKTLKLFWGIFVKKNSLNRNGELFLILE